MQFELQDLNTTGAAGMPMEIRTGVLFAERSTGCESQEPMTTKRFPETVEECHLMIDHLREENDHLRQSGSSFGSLAERLNRALNEERRLGRERRQAHRSSDDRRGRMADDNIQNASN